MGSTHEGSRTGELPQLRFVGSDTPVSSELIIQEARRCGGISYHGITPTPEEQVALLAEIAGTLENKRIIDAGCASGTVSIYLAAGNPRKYGRPHIVTGIDGNQDHLAAARRLTTRFLHPRSKGGVPVRFLQAPLKDLHALPDNSADLLLCSYTTGTDTIYPSLDPEFLRVVADGGHIVFIDEFPADASNIKQAVQTIGKAGITTTVIREDFQRLEDGTWVSPLRLHKPTPGPSSL